MKGYIMPVYMAARYVCTYIPGMYTYLHIYSLPDVRIYTLPAARPAVRNISSFPIVYVPKRKRVLLFANAFDCHEKGKCQLKKVST